MATDNNRNNLSNKNSLWNHFYERDISQSQGELVSETDQQHPTTPSLMVDVDYKEEYSMFATLPTWDPQYSSISFSFSEGNRKITRIEMPGKYFPKAISKLPLDMGHYKLKFMYV